MHITSHLARSHKTSIRTRAHTHTRDSCSCMSQRGIDQDMCPTPQDGGCQDVPKGQSLPPGAFYNNNIGLCTSNQVIESDALDYNAGSFVWSGFDYLGEARGWPQNTKCRGTLADVAGFDKETIHWFRSWWLSNISRADAGRPLVRTTDDDDRWTLRVVDTWTPIPGRTARTINVYTNCPLVTLELNGMSLKSFAEDVPFFGMATFKNVPYKAGNLTALGWNANRTRLLASHSTYTPGAPASLMLSVDVPSIETGTGDTLVADGEDVAMLRATLLDANGRRVPSNGDHNVSFRIVSGDARVVATHNGNPANLSPNHAPWVPTYGGLARAIVRVTLDASSPFRHRIAEIDRESRRNVRVLLHDGADVDDVVVEAKVTLADGRDVTSTAIIPVSTDPSKSPLRVASQGGV